MSEILKNAVVHNIPFWVLTVFAIFLLVGAAFTPPMFVIDSSIIAGVGELAGFGALWCVVKAIDKGTSASLKHHNTEINIGDSK